MNSDLGEKKERAESYPKPIKNKMRTELHYYPVTLHRKATGCWIKSVWVSIKPIKRYATRITISEGGTVTLPNNSAETVWMRDFEIAELFGVMLPTIKSNIHVILKSGVVKADLHHGGVGYDNYILPDYYGMDMITALAFRINSPNAKLFGEYILGKLHAVNTPSTPSIIIQLNMDKRLNKEKVIFN